MTPDDPRRKPLNEYLRQVADLMNLQGWTVEVSDHEPEDDLAVMSVEPNPNIWWAPVSVMLAPRADTTGFLFFNEPKEEQRLDVVHELIHVIVTPQWLWVCEGSWRYDLTPRVGELVKDVYRQKMEQAVHALALLLAPHMPLPPDFPK